jgi:uncharacterized protein YjbI with pentapeptide repeats
MAAEVAQGHGMDGDDRLGTHPAGMRPADIGPHPLQEREGDDVDPPALLDLRAEPDTGPLQDTRWVRYRLTGLSLPGADLRGLYVEACVLDGADLAGAALDGVHVIDSSLFGATLRAVTAPAALLVNVDLRATDLGAAQLAGATLAYCDLRGARFEGADLTDTVWSHCDLRGADLSGAALQGARGDFFWDDATRWPPDFGPQG